jgi:hypothetical protein
VRFSRRSLLDKSGNVYKQIISICIKYWPERKTNYFGQRGFTLQEDEWEDNIHEVPTTLDGL